MIEKCRYYLETDSSEEKLMYSLVAAPDSEYANSIKDTTLMDAEIVGINIKPIITKERKIPRLKKYKVPVIKWGFFVHIKAEDGYQYDAIWDIEDTYEWGPFNSYLPAKIKRKRRRKAIPTIMHDFGTHDLMSMIGMKIKISVAFMDGTTKRPTGLQIHASRPWVNANPLIFHASYFDYKKYDGR